MMADLPFTPREMHIALKQVNKNKSPGSDGITPEFYLDFRDILQDSFFQSTICVLRTEQGIGIVTRTGSKKGSRQDQPIQLATNYSVEYGLQYFFQSHSKQNPTMH